MNIKLSLIACIVATPCLCQNLIFTPAGDPMEVAPSNLGNKALRMVMNASGEPVMCFGTSGHLYVTRWDNETAAFTSPTEIDAASNVFMSDAEGPRMAAQGDYLVLTYQIQGDWANGARSVHSSDGGTTWSEPVALIQGANEDHFMPCVAIDDSGNPFAGVKLGNNPASIYEGMFRSVDGGQTWLEPVNASDPADGNAVCECCPSQPFFAEGRYYDLVRNNNSNIRDFWLLSSADGTTWDGALDVDPLDWNINSCPESGASIAGPVNGTTYVTAFMSAGGASGQSRVYVSRMDLGANGGVGAWMGTDPVTETQFENATQNVPVLAQWNGSEIPLVALAWEQNTGGYDVQLALSYGDELIFTDVAQNMTDAWSGQHRRPMVGFSTDEMGGAMLHLAWQNSSSGTINYLRGGIAEPLIIDCMPFIQPEIFLSDGALRFEKLGQWGSGTWSVWDVRGRLVAQGAWANEDAVAIPMASWPNAFVVRLESASGAHWSRTMSR